MHISQQHGTNALRLPCLMPRLSRCAMPDATCSCSDFSSPVPSACAVVGLARLCCDSQSDNAQRQMQQTRRRKSRMLPCSISSNTSMVGSIRDLVTQAIMLCDVSGTRSNTTRHMMMLGWARSRSCSICSRRFVSATSGAVLPTILMTIGSLRVEFIRRCSQPSAQAHALSRRQPGWCQSAPWNTEIGRPVA